MQYLKHSTLILFAIFVIFFSADAKSPKRTFQSEAIFPLQSQHCHGSTLVELPNHDLLCAWFQGSGERTSDDVVIKGSRYNHKKGQWSEPFLMADVPDFPDINPVLFLDGDKHLWLVWYTVMAYQWSTSLLKYRISEDYMQKNGPPVWKWQDVLHVKADGSPTAGIGQKDSFALKVEKKFDAYIRYLENKGDIREDGRYFTRKELEKARQLYSGLVRGNNLQSDGKETNEEGKSVSKKLGYPLMRRIGWQTRNKPLITDHRILLPLYSDGLNLSLMAITEDEGMHWQFSDPILGGGAIQPTLARNKDHSITMLMRDNGPAPKRLMKSISYDEGRTWSGVEDTEIPNPGTAADLVVLQNGHWALVLNDLEEGRHHLAVWLSEDEGKSWPYRKTLVDGKPGSDVKGHYPAIIAGDDGRIHVCYTHQEENGGNREERKNIVHASFTEEWIKQ